jgi:hypothetical protein
MSILVWGPMTRVVGGTRINMNLIIEVPLVIPKHCAILGIPIQRVGGRIPGHA